MQAETWYCHHCGWSGGLKKNGNGEPGYQKPDYQPTGLPAKVVEWFTKRGIHEETLVAQKIGHKAPQGKQAGAIMFPRHKGGEVVAIKYRTHDKRMWQSKDPEPCFYNHDGAKQYGGDTLIICEGEIDALSFIDAGLPNVASVPDGAPAITAKHLDKKFQFLNDGLVDHFEHFVLAVDNDEPGKTLEKELADRLGRHKCFRVTYPPGCKDANDVLVKHGAAKLREVNRQAKPLPIDGLYTAEDMREAIFNLYAEGLRPGESTGWKSLDSLYTVRTCEMTILTGIPGSGKSTWLDALTVNLNKLHGWKIAFCSPENWPIQRHIAGIAEKIVRKPFAASTPTSERMTQNELDEALNTIKSSFFFTQLQDEDMSIDGVLEVMQAAISRHGVKGIVLDPWNELEYHRPPQMSETEFVSQSLGKIRRFARVNDVHVWIVAHPTKLKRNEDGTYPVPRLYDISGSAHWFNKADNGVAIYRRDHRRDDVEVYVLKIRFREVGKLGSINMKFVKDCGLFVEAEPQQQEQNPQVEAASDYCPF
jgi:twinkle protein